MSFVIAALTDKGIVKEVNQDSFSVKRANSTFGEIVFAIVCDGMGGLTDGEVASGSVVRLFSNWFEEYFSSSSDLYEDDIKYWWESLAVRANETIKKYGVDNQCKLGTTLTAILFVKGMYYCINVGDTRGYLLHNDRIEQLTVDQSYVQREMSLGNLTPEQARVHPYRNVLLQCIGCDTNLKTDFYTGSYEQGDLFFICSDGFRHEVSEQEMLLAFSTAEDSDALTTRISNLIELNKSRGEKDNITCVAVKCM